MGTGLSRCVDGEKRESPRASSGQLEDGRSGEVASCGDRDRGPYFNDLWRMG